MSDDGDSMGEGVGKRKEAREGQEKDWEVELHIENIKGWSISRVPG